MKVPTGIIVNDFDDPDFLRRLAICLVILFLFLGPWLYAASFDSRHLPWEVTCFLEEYGPIMLDFSLAFPLVTSFRRLRTRLRNYKITRTRRRAMLLELPSELILEICDWIMTRPCPRNDPDCPGHPASRQAINEFAKTNKQLRHLIAPPLFKTLSVRNTSWWRADRALEALQSSSHPRHLTKELRIYFHHIGFEKHNPPAPPKPLPQRTAINLSNLSCLTTLSFNIACDQNARFQTVFQNRALLLPSITTLLLSPRADWLISHCPHVRTIAADIQSWRHARLHDRVPSGLHLHALDFIRSASHAAKLQHFEVFSDTWEPCLEAILEAMPHLRSLGQVTGGYDEGISNLFPLLSRFEGLRTLVLAEVHELRVGYDPSGCGNVYMGRHGEEYRQRVNRWRNESMRNVARDVFAAMSGLEVLWIGEYDKAVVKSRASSRGRDDMRWFSEVRKV